jgi:hypothetical protein
MNGSIRPQKSTPNQAISDTTPTALADSGVWAPAGRGLVRGPTPD